MIAGLRTQDVAFVTLLVLVGSLTPVSFRIFINQADNGRDFFAFYDSVADFWRTGFLYAPHPNINLNPPHVSVLLFSPLLLFSPWTAVIVWYFISAVLIGISLWLIQRELLLSRERLAWLVVMILASSAMQHTWRQAQLGAVLLVVSTLTWLALRHGRSGAVPLAVAISIKPWMACWFHSNNLPRWCARCSMASSE